jgi:hypothetical protein
MIGIATLFAAALATAPGDLIRCVARDGSVRWQDTPCARDERSDTVVTAKDGTLDTEALRSRIEALRGSGGRSATGSSTTLRAPRAASASAPPIASEGGPNTPIGEQALAVCSERFLACAHHDHARMDACIAAIPRCGSGGPCCPPPCTAAYARERRAGTPPPDAVYVALLAPDAGGCGPAGP